MVKFFQEIDKRSRAAMVSFLQNHFRYSTANSCNRSTSYANKMKVYNFGLDRDIENKLFDFVQCEEFYCPLRDLIDEFGEEHQYEWQAGFNGRSGGYLVLYQGFTKPSEHKSYCTSCGQKNFTSTTETGTRCGRCGQDTRIDYKTPPMQIGTYPGRSTDQDEDFEYWTMDDLRDRVRLIQDFDTLCDDIVATAVEMTETMEVEEIEEYIPSTRRALVEI